MKLKIVSMIVTLSALSGCAHMSDHKYINKAGEDLSSIKIIDKITREMKKNNSRDNNGVYLDHKILLDNYDLIALDFYDDIEITADINSTLGDAISFITSQVPGLNVAYVIEKPDNLKKMVSLRIKDMPIKDALKVLESVGGLDLYVKNDILYVSDYMVVEGVVSKLETGESTQYSKIKEYLQKTLAAPRFIAQDILVKTESIIPVSSDNENDSFKDVIADKDGKGDVKDAPDNIKMKKKRQPIQKVTSTEVYRDSEGVSPQIIIDESTGTISIKADPSVLRNSKSMIESYLNSILSHATVELNIYKVNNSKARNIGISVSKVINNLYDLSLGSQAGAITNSTLSFQRSVTDNNGDILKTGLNLYEKTGLLSSESSTVLTVFNDVPTKLSDKQTVGYWTPGDLAQNNTIVNGASVVTYTENKPSFNTEEIGKDLVFTPRIDLNKKIINMSISYNDSKIYGEETFLWNRGDGSGGSTQVELKKPLKSKNTINAVITITGENYSLFAGFKSKESDISRYSVPGLGQVPILNDIGSNSVLGKRSDVIFVLKAHFPKVKITEYLTKTK